MDRLTKMRVYKASLMARTASIAVLSACAVFASAEAKEYKAWLDIPAQSLEAALKEFGVETDSQVLFAKDVVAGRTSVQVKGVYTPREALALLTQSAGLRIEQSAESVFLIKSATAAAAAAPQATAQAPTPSPATSAAQDQAKDEGEKVAERDSKVEKVTVTGTRIPGRKPIGAEVIVVDRDKIDKSGQSTVQDVIRQLPQNFNGGPSEDTQLVGGNDSLFNASSGTGINLRGLDAGSTLVLLNGHRFAAGGSQGRFADISGLPLFAIERIEVLPDGASAIYGADAVGGVVNIITRKDLDGAASQARYGFAESGGELFNGAHAVGTNWTTGNALLLGEYYKREPLRYADRSQSASTDLTPFGGTNFSTFFGNPGTIEAGGQRYAIPFGQNGTGLTPANFVAGTQNLQNQNEQKDLVPDTDRWSILGTVRQELSSDAHVFFDALWSERNTLILNGGVTSDIVVPNTNAFFVDPSGGGGPIVIHYNFLRDFGPNPTEAKVQNIDLTGGGHVALPFEWDLTGYFSFSQQREVDQATLIDFTRLNLALADSNPATAFNPFGDGSFTSAATLREILSNARLERTSTFKDTNLLATGPLLSLPGGDVQIAVGGDYRQENLKSITTGLGRVTDVHPSRNVSAAFGEVSIPLFGDSNEQPGFRSLQVSLAGRYEDYSDFGVAKTEKVGIEWSPSHDLSLRGTWSSSYKAPNLIDLDETPNISLILALPDPASGTGSSTALIVSGSGNADLKPATARTWSAGVDFKPDKVPGLALGATYFNIDFQNRVQRVPFSTSILSNPRFASLIDRSPTAAERQTLCSRSRFLQTPANCLGAPIDIILDVRVQNIAQVQTSGLDFSGRYSFETDLGRFDPSIDVTYLFEFAEATDAVSPLVDNLDTQNKPLSVRATASLPWTNGPYGALLRLNYQNSYDDIVSSPRRGIDSWLTTDAQFTYTIIDESNPYLDGLGFAVDVQNVFDEDPPFFNNPLGVGFDQSNADLLGRFVSFTVKKKW